MGAPEQLIFVACLQSLVELITGQACGAGLMLTYTKIPNMLPHTTLPPVLLYAQAPGVAITATCYNRCRDSLNCDGFVVDYKQGACYRINVGRQFEDYQHQPKVNFFRKVCLRVPVDCVKRAWPMEYVPGYKLLAEQHTVLPNIADKWQCAQLCLNQSSQIGLPCRSAQFQAWSRTCTLSQYDRHSSPDSFSPTVMAEREFEYMENQCPVVKWTPGNNPGNEEYCWRDPVYNKTSLRFDLEIDNLTLKQCELRCQTESTFPCNAYTYQCPAYGNRFSRCMLHSDEVQSGVSVLSAMPCTTYRERIACLDVTVSCSSQSMQVTLREKMFPGQIFVRGHAADCSSSNNGQDQVQLTIPLPDSSYAVNKCDVQIVKSIGSPNRTVASAVVIIQHHKLIQTVSDRVVQVRCSWDNNGSPPTPQYNNLTLNASFYVNDQVPVQNVIEGNGNKNNVTYPPTAEMRVIDIRTGGAVTSQLELGDELELQIFVNPAYNVSMMRAGHLIASSGSGQDSLLLLDWRGCPPDPVTFPALSPYNNTALIARFRAFKFPDSNILRFSVILTFCVSVCQPTDCGNGMTSYGKRRRRAIDDVMEEVPLQLEIVFKTPDTKNEASPRPQLSKDDTERMGRSESEVVCATLGTTFMLGLAWVVLQVLLLVGCCCALGRRERQSDTVQLQSDFQPKHVSWEDSLKDSHLSYPEHSVTSVRS